MAAVEFTKLRRSAVWLVVVVLPLLAVTTGVGNYLANPDQLSRGWTSYWSQITVFYSLLFMSLGIAVLAAGVWRPEHRGHNWNLLLTVPAPRHRLVVAKLLVLGVLISAMQGVLLLAAWLVGVLGLGLPPGLPLSIPTVALLSAFVGLAVASFQSLLSMVIRSFAAPIALALPGIILGVGLLLSGHSRLLYLLPYSLLGRALTTGGQATSGSAALSLAEAVRLMVPTLIFCAFFSAVATLVLRSRDVKAS